MEVPPNINALYEDALRYDHQGDTYNAVKLYKKLTKLAPQWAPPFQRLGAIYKYRGEWKPCLHYNKKTVALDSGSQYAWWDLGIAATALKKWRIARNVWSKFGKAPVQGWQPGPVSIRLEYDGKYEILWADSIDPARCQLRNIPHPASGHRYRDILLFDRIASGYQVVHHKRFPVYPVLGLFKRSSFSTYSCRLHTGEAAAIAALEQLCREANLGFELWSNATRSYAPAPGAGNPEYYGPDLFGELPAEGAVEVAIAAKREKQVLQVLKNWTIISLQTFSDLKSYR